MGRGGFRQGGGRPSSWDFGPTKTIRVPEAIAEDVLDIARGLSSGNIVVRNTVHYYQALSCLRHSLTLPANKGGAIKREVVSAICLLEGLDETAHR